MGPRDHLQGLPTGVHGDTSVFNSFSDHSRPFRSVPRQSSAGRGQESPGKECHRPTNGVTPQYGDVNVLLGSQEERQMETHYKPQAVEPFHSSGSLQDGTPPLHPPASSKGLVGDIHRSFGCVPAYSVTPRVSEVCNVRVRGDTICVQNTPIRAVNSASGVYTSHPSASCIYSTAGSSDLYVSGRLANHSGRRGHRKSSHSLGVGADAEPGLVDQPGEIRLDSLTETGFLGGRSRFHSGTSFSHIGASTGSSSRGRSPSFSSVISSPSVAGVSGVLGKSGRGGTMVPTANERTSMAFTCSFPSRGAGHFLSSPSSSVGHSPHPVVARFGQFGSGPQFPTPHTVVGPSDRRVIGGMGSTSGSFPDCGSLEGSMVRPTYQRAGIGSGFSRSSILSVPSSKFVCHGPFRQYHDGSIYQPSGGDTLPKPLAGNEEAVRLVPTAQGDPTGSPPSREGEHHSRPSVSPSGSTDRVVTFTSGDTPDLAGVWAANSRSVCVRGKRAATSVLRAVTGRRGVENRRILLPLAPSSGLRLPSVRPHSSGPCQGKGRRGQTLAGGPQLAGPAVVSVASGASVRHTESSSVAGRSSSDAEIRGDTSSRTNALSHCLADLRQSFVERGLSEEAASMAARGRRQSTLRMYATRFELFREWCSDLEVHPHSASVGIIADFLLYQFNMGKQVNTVKGFRSAIALLHKGFTDGSSITSNRTLEQLVKGMFHERPMVRRLAPPWSMTTVLETLGRPPFEPLRLASLRDLSIKTVFLLSAASARRRSAIHALSLRRGHINFESNGVRLIPDPSFLAKNQTIDFLPNPIFIPTLSSFSDTEEDKVWCPVRCLKAYIKATQPLRGSSTALFISLNKPHTPVSRDTISRWITLAITADPSAILGGEKATAHQVRAMATSIALFAGVPIAEILATAVWKTATTFVAAYLRDIPSTEGALAVSVLARSSRR